MKTILTSLLLVVILSLTITSFAQIVDESTTQSGFVSGAGPTSYSFVAQSFYADVSTISKFGVWLQEGASKGEVRIAIAPDNGSGNADVNSVVYESALIDPGLSGMWYYETGLSIQVDTGKKYYVLIDGYKNPSTSGYSSVGTSTGFTDTGETMKASKDGGVTCLIYIFKMAVYVEGYNCVPIQITGLDTNHCMNNTPVTLGGSPSGGIFSGSGMTDSTFKSSSAGLGTHKIIYTYTDTSGCSGADTQIVNVFASPAADFTYSVAGNTVNFTDNSTTAVFWDWDFDDGSNSNSVSPTHYFLYGGVYDVTLTVHEDSAVCYDSKTKQVDMTHLGVKELAPKDMIRIYPNPIADNLFIQLERTMKLEIEIFNMLGERIMVENVQTTEKRISLKTLPAGNYLVHVKWAGGYMVERLVKL